MIQRRKPLARSKKPIRRRNPDRKPAPWTEAFPEQVSETESPKKVVKRRKPVLKQSTKTRAKRDLYNREAKKWKALTENSTCRFPGCKKPTTDVHHSRGRAGSLLLDKRFWIPLCREHHDWVGVNMGAARKLGLLCETGLWNTPADGETVLHSPEPSGDLPQDEVGGQVATDGG